MLMRLLGASARSGILALGVGFHSYSVFGARGHGRRWWADFVRPFASHDRVRWSRFSARARARGVGGGGQGGVIFPPEDGGAIGRGGVGQERTGGEGLVRFDESRARNIFVGLPWHPTFHASRGRARAENLANSMLAPPPPSLQFLGADFLIVQVFNTRLIHMLVLFVFFDLQVTGKRFPPFGLQVTGPPGPPAVLPASRNLLPWVGYIRGWGI